MPGDIAVFPAPGALQPLRAEGIVDLVDDLMQEGSRSRGRIEDQDPVDLLFRLAAGVFHLDLPGIGQAVLQAEVGLQNMIDAADDVGNHRLRRVIDTPRFAHFRIVGRQKGFIKVDDRVFAARRSAEILQDGRHVGALQDGCQIVHDPDELLMEIGTGDVVEHPAEKRVGFGQVVGGLLADEMAFRFCVAPGRKKTVGDCLGVHVGELFFRQVME